LTPDVPERYRAWTLDNYAPALIDAFAPFLSGQAWSLYLRGAVGTRKTSIAAALLAYWRKTHLGSRGTRYGEFVDPEKLRRALLDFDAGPERLKHWRDAPMLVLDDLGALRNTPHAQEHQMLLVCARYDHQRPTICTSNLNLDALAAQIDARVASRLQEGVCIDLGTHDWRKGE